MKDGGRRDWDEGILLKIYRDYTDDEKVNVLIAATRDKDVEIGMLKSTIVELEDKYSNKDSLTPGEIEQLKQKGWVNDILVNERIKQLEDQIKVLNTESEKKKIEQEVKKKKEWQDKYFELRYKYEQLIKKYESYFGEI